MNTSAVLLLCIQALVQMILTQCSPGATGYGARVATAPILGCDGGCPIGALTGLAAAGFGNAGSFDVTPYGGTGEGNVAVIGDLPIAGNTAVIGQVPILGAVNFVGNVPAADAVSISGRCSCGCSC